MNTEPSFYNALMKFADDDANFIVSCVGDLVFNISDYDINQEDIQWLLNCFYYGLKKGKKNILPDSINFYINEINRIIDNNNNDISEEQLSFLLIYFEHLKDAFSNIEFNVQDYGYLIAYFNKIPSKRFTLDQKAFSCLWDLLIIAEKWINRKDSDDNDTSIFMEITDITVITCFLQFFEANSFNEYFKKFQSIKELNYFKRTFSIGLSLYYNEYANFFISNIGKNSKKEKNHHYLLEIINKEFSKQEKHLLFSKIVLYWKESCIEKEIEIGDLPIQEIKNNYLEWFSIDEENDPPSFHPIFELLRLQKLNDDEELVNICKTIINYVIDMKPGKENTLFYYLPVYSYDFLMENQDFFKIIANKLSSLIPRITVPDENIIIHLIFLRNYLNFGYENILESLRHKEPSFYVEIINLFSLLIFKRKNLYEVISKLIKKNEDVFNQIFLIGCFATIISKDYANEIKFNFDLWNYSYQKKNSSYIFLFGLLILIKCSKYFENNPNEKSCLINLFDNYKDLFPNSELTELFIEILKIAFYTEKGNVIQDSYLPEDYKFKFCTKNAIICVGINKIAVHHGFGINIYNEDYSNSKKMEIKTDEMNGYEKTQEIDDYQSQIKYDSNFEEDIDNFDEFVYLSDENIYGNQEEVSKYEKIPGYHFLCNYGFTSYEHIRIVENSEVFDLLNNKNIFNIIIPIFHLKKENEHYSYIIQETCLFKKIVNNFTKYNSVVCTFFSLSNKEEINLSKMNLLTVLNENQIKFNIKSNEFSRFQIFVLVTPISNSQLYKVDIKFNQNYFNNLFKSDRPIHFYSTLDDISLILIILSFLISTVGLSSKKFQGIETFVKPFQIRSKVIEKIFEQSKEFDFIDFLMNNAE